MSRSFTSRPSVTNTRGRGRGTQARQFHPVNLNRNVEMNRAGGRGTTVGQGARPGVQANNVEDQATDYSPERQQNAPEQRMTYQGGFTVIAPNQRRRQQITQVAQRETEAYEAHRQQNTPGSFNYVGTVGGGQISQAEARQRIVQTSPNKTAKLLKNQERKSYFKEKEEEEIKKKKDEQRRKAEQNEARQREQELAAEHRWDDPRKRANEAFLQRLEAQNKKGGAQSTPSVAQSKPSYQEGAARTPGGAMGSSSDVAMYTQQSANNSGLSSAETQRRVAALAAMFPQLTEPELFEALRLVDFSLDAAVDLLNG